MHQYQNCPLCKNSRFSHWLSCEDYTVSHQKFNIVSCEACGFKFTNPIPEPGQLGTYYQSEDYISHSNTKRGFLARLYHAVRAFTLRRKLKLVASFVSRGTILDYGCGTGMFLGVCKNAGWDCRGIEPDPGAAAIARSQDVSIFDSKEDLVRQDPERTFDAITLWHVLEHVTDLEQTVRFLSERLKSSGVLIIAVPNHSSFDAKHYKEFWAAYDVPRHLYHFTPDSLGRLMLQSGFALVETQPMKFDSFYVSMLSEKYRSGSINYLRAFFTGLRSNLAARSARDYSSVIYIFKKKSA